MANARVAVDYLGNGNLQDIFQGTLPISDIEGVIDVPQIAASADGKGSWDFTLPTSEASFLICTKVVGSDTYFQRISGSTWRLAIQGQSILVRRVQPNGPIEQQDNWKRPYFNDVGEVQILWGRLRG